MNIQHLTDFHIRASTPLLRLGNCVRWFEEMGDRSAGQDRQSFRRQAKVMREVVTNVFVHRHVAGEYAE